MDVAVDVQFSLVAQHFVVSLVVVSAVEEAILNAAVFVYVMVAVDILDTVLPVGCPDIIDEALGDEAL